MVATGFGGIDWAAVPLAAAYYGLDDMDMLIHRLLVFKLHKPEVRK